ncbi:MAG: alpha/beta hydrolase [Vulcanococcus sp.]
MTIRRAIREQVRHERRNIRHALLLLLACALLAALVCNQRLRGALLSVLTAADLRVLLLWCGAALLLLIPIAGIVSLASQFAFWEGWLDGLPDVETLWADPGTDRDGEADGAEPATIVYLDGIHQSELDHPPRVAAFLAELEQRLPAGVCLLRGLETYTVMPVALREDSGGSWFWRRLFALQEQHPAGWVPLLAAVLVQANNVIKVGISSDRRYGPIRHYELALKIVLRLREQGFRPGGSGRLILLGYSGGGEMAFGVADYLSRIARVPLHIISFCGVFSGEHVLERVASIGTVVGDRDPVAAFGNIAYPGRSPLLPFSRWRRALASGRVQRVTVAGMHHNGASGPFSDRYRSAVVASVLELLPPLTAAG